MFRAWLATAVLIIFPACSRPAPSTVSSTSPDMRYRIELREVDAFIDRNFEIVLADLTASPPSHRVIFSSPDEGPPGTERFIWSPDSRAVLLVGKNFFTAAGEKPQVGERAYLLFEVQTATLWCNAAQSSDPRFGAAELAQFHLDGWRAID